VLSVDIEAEVNAGHCVEPDNEMQVSAITPGVIARADSSTAFVLKPIDRCLRWLAACPADVELIVEARVESPNGVIS
jgi:hypothetical protein